MFVPAWQELSPAHWMRSASTRALPFPLSAPHVNSAYVARSLVYHLFAALKLPEGATVLVPDYHHGNEIRAIRAAGATLKFYPVRRNLEMDLEEVARLCRAHRPRVLFVIHYLGWPQPIKDLLALCREHDMILVEDCALSFLSETAGRPLGSFGDYAIFCLYKTLPVPNGGLLVQNGRPLDYLDRLKMTPCSTVSLAGRVTELTLEWLRHRCYPAGQGLFTLKLAAGKMLSALKVKRTPVGDTGFNLGNVHLGMSSFSERLLPRLDYDAIRTTRRSNYLRLCDGLSGPVALLKPELEPGICPLFFPLLVKDKHAAARELRRRGVDSVEFWNEGDPEARSDSSTAQFLRAHLLELPIHQDASLKQMDYVAQQVIETNIALPSKDWVGR